MTSQQIVQGAAFVQQQQQPAGEALCVSLGRRTKSVKLPEAGGGGSHWRHPAMTVTVGGRSGRHRLLQLLLLHCVCSVVFGCIPGRGAFKRRRPPKSNLLVFGQQVPERPELSPQASGPPHGAIHRDDDRFAELTANYNENIRFVDYEGTGADRVMSQRAARLLNALSLMVMNMWPGVKLTVLDSWLEGRNHYHSVLHHEGRAVDICTSDRDKSKLGTLAAMAVMVGFDYVNYRTRKEIHVSVKSDETVHERAPGEGCFSAATVLSSAVAGNPIGVDRLQHDGSRQLAGLDPSATLVASPVLLWLHLDGEQEAQFVSLVTGTGRRLEATADHLVYVLSADDVATRRPLPVANCSTQLSNGTDNCTQHWTGVSSEALLNIARTIPCGHVAVGDFLLAWTSGRLQPDRVAATARRRARGVYAPLTTSGNVVLANGLVASCYSRVRSQRLAHAAMAPVRWWRQLRHRTCAVFGCEAKSGPPPVSQAGVHWYARLLVVIAELLWPAVLD